MSHHKDAALGDRLLGSARALLMQQLGSAHKREVTLRCPASPDTRENTHQT